MRLPALVLATLGSGAVGVAAAQLPSLPRFRASDVRVVHDTAWFFSANPSEPTKRHPLIGYVPATREWVTMTRRWSVIDSLANYRARSGPVTAYFGSVQSIGLGFRLIDDRTGEDADTIPRYSLIRADGRRIAARIAYSATERRAMYRQGGGSLTVRGVAPPFSRQPEWWAASHGRVVLAFPAARPPDRPWFWTQERDDGQWKYAVRLSGIVVLDSATMRLTPLAHPSLIERDWLGTVFVGKSLFVLPTDVDNRYHSEIHAAAERPSPPLARFDFATRRWTMFREGELPFDGVPFAAIDSDDGHVYAMNDLGVAVLDVAANTWSARYYVDVDTTLADGADSALTHVIAVAPVRAVFDPSRDADTATVLASIAERLRVRHRTALQRELARLIPFDTLMDLHRYATAVEERAEDYGDIELPFGVLNQVLAPLMARPEFEPFLLETMRHADVQPFALDAIRRLGDDHVVAALRATLRSGTPGAAVAAADTLLQRGDSTAMEWLRGQVTNAEVPLEIEPTSEAPGGWPFRTIVWLLASHNDTTSLPALLALLRPPESKLARVAQHEILRAMLVFPSADAKQRIADAVRERSWLHDAYREQ